MLHFDALSRGKVDRVTSASTVEEAWPAFCRIVRDAGYDYAIYGTNRLRHSGNFGDKAHTFFLTDLPDTFMTPFWEQERYRHTFAALWAVHNTGALSLREAAQPYHNGSASETQRRAHEEMVAAGVTSGHVIGFNRPEATTVAAIGLINFGKSHAETDAIWRENGPQLESYARIFHLKVSSLPLPVMAKGLTNRQKDVLRWIARGKTTSEVATILGLSQATIEKHLRQARDNLQASNTTQAVLNAQVYTGIFDNRK